MREGWQVKTLGDICDIARGGSPRPIQKFLTDRADGINWVKIADATASSKYIYKTEEKIIPEGAKRSRLVRPGDFLLSNSMSFGRPYIMKTTGCIHDGWLVLSDKSGLFDQDYLYYFLGSAAAYKQFDNLAAGSTVRNLNTELVKRVTVPLPPLAEQQRIVAILDEAFAGLATAAANAEKNLENARELFDSQLQSVLMNGGADWKQCTLEQICSFTSGGTPPKGNASYWKGSIPWVSGRDMKTDRLSDAALHISQAAVNDSATRMAPVGALLILVRGMGLANGIAVAEVMAPCAFNQDIKAIHPTSEMNPRFLLLSLRSAFARPNKLLSNAAHGTLKIEIDELREVRVPVPPRKVQDDIASRIDALSMEAQRLVAAYKDKLTRLAALKQSILQKAFSGELTSPPSQAIKEAAE